MAGIVPLSDTPSPCGLTALRAPSEVVTPTFVSGGGTVVVHTGLSEANVLIPERASTSTSYWRVDVLQVTHYKYEYYY